MKDPVFQLTDVVRETAYAVHCYFGPGHLEKVYENALVHRLRKTGLNVKQQHPLTVRDEDGTVVCDFHADIVVEDSLLLELKAAKAIADEHIAQMLGYLRAARLEHGAVLNFGAPRFEIRKLAMRDRPPHSPGASSFIKLLLPFLLLFLFSSVSFGQAKPNILFLFADDQRADTIAAHGNPHIQTPNLDKLVGSGFSFRGNYIFGGNSGAVCMPSRAMLMSGKTWFHIDTVTLKDAKLLPEFLREHGYETFGTGKWHNGQPSWLRAFQHGKTIMFGGMANHSKVPVRDLGPDGKLTAERVGEKFSSEMFADSAIEFLKNHDVRKPFFAYVAFTAPHDPRMPLLPYREMYYRNLPPLPPNFLPQLPFDNGMMAGGRDENLGAWPRTEAMIRDQLAEYYGMITHLDEQIGRILEVLKQTGQADNTLIIYAADNGLALGSHGLLGKQNVFEHSMRVPLIFVGPGIPQGQSTRAFTYLLDVFPTLCDTLGIRPPADLEGESLRPLWEGKKAKVRDSVFLPFIQIQRAVRDDRWKLIAYPKIGHLQLFDLQTDPNEQTNRIDQAESAEHVQRLLKLMKQWQAKVGDKLQVPTENRTPPKIDLTGRKRVPDQWQPDWIVKKYFEPAGEPSK